MHGQENVLLCRGIDAEEFGGGDAGDGERIVVDQHGFAHRFGNVAEAPLRVAVTDDRRGRTRPVVGGIDQAPGGGRMPSPAKNVPETY